MAGWEVLLQVREENANAAEKEFNRCTDALFSPGSPERPREGVPADLWRHLTR